MSFILPRSEQERAFGGYPCCSPLLSVRNRSQHAVRIEVRRQGDAEQWHVVVPCVGPQEAWEDKRHYPLYIPRGSSVRAVSLVSAEEVFLRPTWGEGEAILLS